MLRNSQLASTSKSGFLNSELEFGIDPLSPSPHIYFTSSSVSPSILHFLVAQNRLINTIWKVEINSGGDSNEQNHQIITECIFIVWHFKNKVLQVQYMIHFMKLSTDYPGSDIHTIAPSLSFKNIMKVMLKYGAAKYI